MRRAFRRGFAALALAALTCGTPTALTQNALAAPGRPIIVSAAATQRAGSTQVAISFNARVTYSVFTLTDPDRVVVDLPDVAWRMTPEAAPQPTGVFSRIRYGHYKPGVSRIVLDCRAPVVVAHAEMVASGAAWRLLLDLRPAGAQRPTDDAMVADDSGSSENGSATASGAVQLAAAVNGAETPAPLAIGATGIAMGDVGTRDVGTLDAADARGDNRDGIALLSPAPARNALIGATLPATALFARPEPRPGTNAGRKNPANAEWVIAIDPGHGGQDPGAIGADGVYEKQITLATARLLRSELQSLKHYRVVLTRNRDTYIKLRERIQIARAAGADLFVSLHADKMENQAVRGLSVYTLSERASDAEAAALADRENKVDRIAGVNLAHESPEVANILIDLVQRETMNQSARFASLLVDELRKETALLPKSHRFAGFAVLKAPDVPSVLIELGYLSNASDSRLLQSDAHRRQLARAIARAIDGYFVRVEARSAG